MNRVMHRSLSRSRVRHLRRVVVLLAGIALGPAVPAMAQPVDDAPRGEGATDLAVLAGVTTNADATGLALAGIAGWQISPRFGLEARFGWYDREEGSTAFGADAGITMRVPTERAFSPFATAAFGVYRASFDAGVTPASDFYRDRLPEDHTGLASFADTALRVGGGLHMAVGRNVTIRPEVSVIIVWDGSRTHTLALIGVRVGYIFEEKPVTPARRAAPGTW
jgi:hypothetical protein